MFCSKKSGCCESVLSWAVKFSIREPLELVQQVKDIGSHLLWTAPRVILVTIKFLEPLLALIKAGAGGGGSYNCKIVEIIHGTNINNIFSQPFTLLSK